jgi:rare lipoprotein A
MTHAGRWLVCALALGLVACGSAPPRDEGASSTPPRGGGYYKDDGPGDAIPPNLAEVPDAVPKREPLSRAANRPYEVFGTRYVPLTRVQPFHEQGMASWYGRRYHGKKTSSGEPYDMYAMTAAHPTLPIPSYVRVAHLASGRSVVVRINDRGPFLGGRVIDLSYVAAFKLGYIGAGSTRVEVSAIVPGAPAAAAQSVAPSASTAAVPAAEATPGFYLQLAAFSARAGAESMREQLARQFDWAAERIHVVASGGLYKVQLGPYESRDEASGNAERIATALNFRPFVVVR